MDYKENYFLNYKEEKHLISRKFWILFRILSVSFTLYLIYALLYKSDLGLFLLWNVVCASTPLSSSKELELEVELKIAGQEDSLFVRSLPQHRAQAQPPPWALAATAVEQ